MKFHQLVAQTKRHRLALAVVVLLLVGQATWVGFIHRQVEHQSKVVSQMSSRMNAYKKLAKGYRELVAATEAVPNPGKSWAHRFVVTAYTPTNQWRHSGMTATAMKADPARHIVAVDPLVIPLHSKVWIEGLGWFIAEDTGSAIKQLRLDVLMASEAQAMQFGKKELLVIVVPA